MPRGSGWLAIVLVAASAAMAVTEPPVAVSTEVAVGDVVRVSVQVENTGSDELRMVTPEVRYRLAEREGAATTLLPGARHTWNVEFPSPRGPDASPLIVLARWEDRTGARHSLPYARVVETSGLLPTEAQVIVESEPAAAHERAVVRVTNATGNPLRGRLVALIPDEFFTTPAAQPVEVPPRESVRMPIDVQSNGAPGTTYPLYAILQFEQGGMPRAIVARTLLGIGTTPSRATVPPVVIGIAGLVLAVVLVLFANRRAARRRADRDARG